LVQHRADLFPEPLIFRPERFLSSTPPAAHFLPWGGGLRRCVGAAFSELEMTLVMARLLQKINLRLGPTVAARPTPAVFRGITIIPAHRVPVEVIDRA
jgi:cytochrome P450